MLAQQKCKPIQKGTPPLTKNEAQNLHKEIPEWALNDNSIEKEYQFKDFKQAMHFVNHVAEIVNEEDHHPDILISYNKVKLTFSTHSIKGLSNNDFIVAAKIYEMAKLE